jgi:hypothetical protein
MPPAFLARFGVVRLNQLDQRMQMCYYLHLSQGFLPFGLRLDGGELVIREAKLIATFKPILACNHDTIAVWTALVFQSLLGLKNF